MYVSNSNEEIVEDYNLFCFLGMTDIPEVQILYAGCPVP